MTHHRKGSKRQARRASIERKRGAFGTGRTPNKKAPAERQGYDLSASRTPNQRPGSEPNTPTNEVLSHEFCQSE